MKTGLKVQTVLGCAVILSVLLVTAGIGGGATAIPAVTDDADANTSTITDPKSTVDSELEDVAGEVEVVVRFTDPATLDDARRKNSSLADRKNRAAVDQRALEAFVEETDGVELERRFWLASAAVVTVDTDAVPIAKLAAVDGVERVHKNYEIDPPDPDEIPQLANSPEPAAEAPETTYGLERIRAPEVWDEFDTRGEGVTVAVLDSGVDADHPDIDLAAENWAEFDKDGDRIDSEPYDENGHGTHVSGTVVGGNESGTNIGVAPDATLMHGAVLSPEGGSFTSLISGMEWAVENDADIISMSVGSTEFSDEVIEPVRMAEAEGVTVIAAAGNEEDGSTESPGNVYDSIAVGSTDDTDTVASDSSGELVDTADEWDDPPSDWPDEYVVPDVVAPGVQIRSADPGGEYRVSSGTSMATPHVAGTAALVLSMNEDLSPDDIQTTLETTASVPPDGPDEKNVRYGHGIVDAYEAVEMASNVTIVTGTITDTDGTPLSDVSVDIDGDRSTRTDESGRYALGVGEPGTERTINVSGFGIESTEETVETTGTDEIVQNFEVDTKPDVEFVSAAPSQVNPGEAYDVEVRISAVETVSVTNEGTISDVTISGDVDTSEASDVSDRERGETLITTVEPGVDSVGTVSLTYKFETATNESLEMTTSTTSVLSDPLTVGTDGDFDTIQEALDFSRPGTTIKLVDDEYEIDAADAPIEIDTPVELTAAVDADPVISIASDTTDEVSSGITVQADGTTISNLTLIATDATDGIAISGGATDVRLVNNTITGPQHGIWINGRSNTSVTGNTVVASRLAIDVWGTAETVEQNRFDGETIDLSITPGGVVGPVNENEFVGNGTGISASFDSSVANVTNNRFAGTVGMDIIGDVERSQYNDYSTVTETAIATDGVELVSELDYFGDRGPEEEAISGPVEFEPFATEEPTELETDPADVQHFGYQLEVKANETTAVSFPGPMEHGLETTFGEFSGSIYEYDTGANELTSAQNWTDPIEPLDAYVVSPEENVTVLVEFASESSMPTPTEADVEAGWNLIGAPMVAGADDAYAATSAEPSRLLHPFESPVGVATVDDQWTVHTFDTGTEPVVDAHTGYFLYANQDGTVAANAYPGITLSEFRDVLYADDIAVTDTKGGDKLSPPSDDHAEQRSLGGPTDQIENTQTRGIFG